MIAPTRLLALAALLAAAGAAAGCARAPGGADEAAALERPDHESWGATLRLSEGGRPRLVLAAPYAARYERADSAYTRLSADPLAADSAAGSAAAAPVSVVLFDAGGGLAGRVTAPRLTYFDRERRFAAEGGVTADIEGAAPARLTAARLDYAEADGRFVAEGGVVVATADGRRLETARLVWDQAAGSFRTDGAFTFTTPTERIRGVGLASDAGLRRYSFSRATGQIEVRE